MLLTKLPNPIGLVIVGLAAIVSLVVTKDMGRVVIDG
jgi:hypothetical protein